MYTEKKNSKLEKKLQIKDLAQIATEKIHENKLLLETLSFYKQKIEIIKSFMNRKNNNENSEIKTTANSTEIKSNIDEPNINESIKKEK